jgi:hypothetical protein
MDRTTRAQSTRFRFNQFVTMLVVVAAAVVAGIAISFCDAHNSAGAHRDLCPGER